VAVVCRGLCSFSWTLLLLHENPASKVCFQLQLVCTTAERWEDGTPNIRGQLTSLWVLGERPRNEPVRYAPPALREPREPEPPCCAAVPACFQPGCGPWGGGGFRNNETEPGSDFGGQRNGGGRNLDDFVDFNEVGLSVHLESS
jgi:hypothetical protein